MLHRPLLLPLPLLRRAWRLYLLVFLHLPAAATAPVQACCFLCGCCCISNAGLQPVQLSQCLHERRGGEGTMVGKGEGVQGYTTQEDEGKQKCTLYSSANACMELD